MEEQEKCSDLCHLPRKVELIQKRSEIPISHSEEDEENREFNRNMSERPILIDSDVISIDLQIYDDVGSARSL